MATLIKRLAILNTSSVIAVILVNYISQAFRLNGTTIGEVSSQYENLFTPAGYAFSIWGIVYLGLIAFVAFQIRRAFFSKKASEFIQKMGYNFAIANIANALWVIAFHYDFILTSVFLMLIILYSLLKIVLSNNMEKWDAPIEIIAFVWWPICIYSGWIAVATIANIAAFLTKIGFDGGGLSEVSWTFLMIVIATILNILMIFKRNMREFALVGVWALVAIYVRHQETQENIAFVALGGAAVIAIYVMLHGFRNRATSPFVKLKQRLRS
ncbi:tryptophan-rich sensory protein [Galbibacter mesophilus]|uniref:tryptophan-rich sensory protein n=1 Tax=Galbibacter mesophilus TaxID=379069 RepID=UPI00191E140C|nr:tryptophan-rich sensory protein [Galbibacter mesophilus]MCM5662014.1 tryptophan-rich sensory protein [Galbibacter mesophilus]